ncbi:MAG: DUF4177 domain-containing protein [Verrucomicrobia bacterium]|nr:DUF4177 domain-containing protein [Verrucomicrobiota bacterium]
MMTWEFKTCKVRTKGLLGGKFREEELDARLNELGQQGWELVSLFTTNRDQGATRDIVAVFKRAR